MRTEVEQAVFASSDVSTLFGAAVLVEDDATFEPPGTPTPGEPRVLVVACGAIAREVLALVELNGWRHVTLRCLPASLHNTPKAIAERVEAKLVEAEGEGIWDRVFVAYGDCGTGGALDGVLDRRGVGRLPGDHCYAFLAGIERWLALHEAEPGTFYLTDFLCRHFDRLVIQGLGLDRHPELMQTYFGNYRRLVYLTQSDDPGLQGRAERAARTLGLPLEVHRTGLGDLAPALAAAVDVEESRGS